MKKYIAVYEDLKKKIETSRYHYNEKLPSESDLMRIYSVSRQTVRNALDMLKKDNYISSIQGSGYRVILHVQPKRSRTIAVITTYISRSIFPFVLNGIEKTATENGFSVAIRSTNNSIQKETDVLMDLINGSPITGIIVEGTKSALPNVNTQYYEQLAAQGVPIVFINGAYSSLIYKNHPNIRFVFMDDYAGGYSLVNKLHEKGHKKIAGIFKSDDIQGLKRYEGFSKAIYDNDMLYDDNNIFWITSETNQISQEFLNHVSSGCTAAVCYCDEYAIQVAQYLRKNQSSITDVMSFDRDNYIHLKVGMHFYSLGYQKEHLGTLATQKMINMIHGKDETSELLPWIE